MNSTSDSQSNHLLSLQSNSRELIENAFDENHSAQAIDEKTRQAILAAVNELDQGKLRVMQKSEGASSNWMVNEWVKKAILLYFRIQSMEVIEVGPFTYYDKIPLKRWTGSEGVRVVPQALVRRGAFIESGAILMPSYVNIGAYVGTGTMVDTWATVGSCAQIGSHVHLSGGVGIGGVLEPIQAQPVVIGDHVFVGSRCIVVEGVQVEEGAVLGAGLTLTASTKILDVTGSELKEYRGRIPKNSVVIPGTVDKKFAAGTYGTPCALIIGQRTESTDRKTSLTDVLREFQIPL